MILHNFQYFLIANLYGDPLLLIFLDLDLVLEENGFAIFEISPDLKEGLIGLLRLILPNYRYEFIVDINHFLRFLYIEK